TMADTIVVLNEGRVEQAGSPMDLYHRPRTEFVAGFIGAPSMNVLAVEGAGESVQYGSASFTAPGEAAAKAIRLGVRPEHVLLCAPGEGDLTAKVRLKEALGGESYLYVMTETGDQIVVRAEGESPVKAGDPVGLTLPTHRLHLFAADGETVHSGALPA
ncbi:MAG: TOBE domain-containing protein, partial [Pseudomonadota bacterium]